LTAAVIVQTPVVGAANAVNNSTVHTSGGTVSLLFICTCTHGRVFVT
jgi:hypothetical protein